MTDLLPDALADALGRVVSDLRKEWSKDLERINAESRAVSAEFQVKLAECLAGIRAQANEAVADARARAEKLKDGAPGKDADPETIRAMVADAVGAAVAEIPKPKDGEDGKSFTVEDAVPLIETQVVMAVAALPLPKDGRDGKSVDPAEVKALVDNAVGAAVAAFPVPVNGKDADPEATRALIEAEVAKAAAAIPVPKDGTSVTAEDVAPIVVAEVEKVVAAAVSALPKLPPGTIAEAVQRVLDGLPKPKDGKSVTVEDVEPIIAQHVAKAAAAIPVPVNGKDGVGLAGALIDRSGALVLTLTDGTTKELGQVVGRDVDPAAVATRIRDEVAKIPAPQDGKDGLGFDDMTVEHDGERSFKLRFTRGTESKEFPITLPLVLDKGVYRDGQTYQRGDGVSWAGSFWIAQDETAEKPDTGKGWRMAVKRGRDGKEGPPGKSALPPPVVRADR